MLTTMGEEVMTDAEVDELLAEVDVDGSGVIDMDEFKNMPCWIPPQALQSRRARHSAPLSGREPGALWSGGEILRGGIVAERSAPLFETASVARSNADAVLQRSDTGMLAC